MKFSQEVLEELDVSGGRRADKMSAPQFCRPGLWRASKHSESISSAATKRAIPFQAVPTWSIPLFKFAVNSCHGIRLRFCSVCCHISILPRRFSIFRTCFISEISGPTIAGPGQPQQSLQPAQPKQPNSFRVLENTYDSQLRMLRVPARHPHHLPQDAAWVQNS